MFGDMKENWGVNISVNLRQHFTLYPNGILWIHTDGELNDNRYNPIIKKLAQEGLLKLTIVKNEGLQFQQRWKTMMMLWRLLPIWEDTDYVFCRDLDSILTPRQLQCSKEFINSGKIAHGINDNDAHDLPLMGGMCGFKSKEFIQCIGNKNLNDLVSGTYNQESWQNHGTDQRFLNRHIHPLISHSFLMHKLQGPNRRSDIKTVCNVDVSEVSKEIQERGDDFCNYIGACGNTASNKEMIDFYNQYGNKEKCQIITKIEKEYNFNE